MIAAPLAISLDLDDTLWPVGPVLEHAERVLADWLAENAPRTAARTDTAVRTAIRRAVVADHPGRAHDMSFLRREGLRRAMQQADEDPALADAAFETFLAARQQVTLFDDVLPVLSRWAARVPLVAVSNGNADVARVGLGGYFAGSVAAHELGCAKPDARMFHAACRIAGVAPPAVLHVGDDPELDVAGACRAGLRAAWLSRPQFAHRHGDAVAPARFGDLHALDRALFG